MEKYVVHCPDIKFSKEVIPVKQQTFETLLKTKKVRQRLCSANFREEQCSYIPLLSSEQLTHFWPMFPFYTILYSWKHQKTFDFLVFSGGIKWEHWPEMGQSIIRRCYQKFTNIKHLSKRKLEQHVEKPKISLWLSVGNKQSKTTSRSSLVNVNRNNGGIRRG